MPSGNLRNGQKKVPKESAGEQALSRGLREGAPLTVKQPPQLRSLLMVLADLEKITERVSEDRSTDPAGGGAGTGGAGEGHGATAQRSLRAASIQALPPYPVMKRRLIAHLEKEMRRLEREARRIARMTRKGSAHLLTQLYARIRKIQSLIVELVEATTEVIRRLYIRLFIDHQQLI